MNTNNHSSSPNLKIVVIGGTGLIGKQVVSTLRGLGHTVTAASPSQGINTVTGEGLAAALTGAQVVVDVANSPSFADAAVMEFFEKSGRNLASAEQAAGVRHHVALSVVGTDRMQAAGYFRAKLAQENLIKASGVPYTIVRATQFFEFVRAIAGMATAGEFATVAPALMQPIASADVAAEMVRAALAEPLNGIVDIAGPEAIRQDELLRRLFAATHDKRTVKADAKAGYYGTPVDDRSLVPIGEARLGKVRFEEWLGAVPAGK